MKVKIILNPYANRWRSRTKGEQLPGLFARSGVDYDLAVTRAPGEGIAIAESAVNEGYDALIAAGGDGTINEVINGILRATPEGPTLPFGILPFGTANDFYNIVGLPESIEGAVNTIKAGNTRQIDAGKVNDRYFVNNSAITMEPTVTLESLKIERVSGEARYLLALMRAIAHLTAWNLDVRWDDGSFQGPAYLLSVCNSERTGGFTMAPGAMIDDGQFDLVLLPEVPRFTFLYLLLQLLRGKHCEHEQVIFTRVTEITIASDPGTPVHADGEVFSPSATDIHYTIMPGKVTLLCPA